MDDEADFRLLTSLNLMSAGFDVVEAEDGRQAMEVIARARPDMVVMDLLMNNSPGWPLLKAIRQDPATHELPVVVCSALDHPMYEAQMWSLGADAMVTKSGKLEGLIATMQDLFALNVLERETRRHEQLARAIKRTRSIKNRTGVLGKFRSIRAT